VTLVRWQNLKWVSFLLVLTFFMSIAPLAAEASVKIDAGDLLKIILDEVTKDSKPEEPPAQTNNAPQDQNNDVPKADTQVAAPQVNLDNLVRALVPAEWMLNEEFRFLIDATPIKRNDGSTWHRMVFEIEPPYAANGLHYQIKEGSVPAYPDNYRAPEFSYPYVNAKYIKKSPLTKEDKVAIEDFKHGRPCRIKVGDDMSYNTYYWMTVTQKTIFLYKEPQKNTQKINLPKGSKIIYPVAHPSSGDTTPFPGTYIDMDDTVWLPIIDLKSKKMLGWYGPDSGDFFENMGYEIVIPLKR
jgi:hypothetical protein